VVPVTVAGIGVSESELGRSLSLFPNPTSGNLSLDFHLSEIQNVEVTILNAAGQTVYYKYLGLVDGPHQHSIDLSHCASGLYLLQVRSEKGVVTRRLALQK